MIRLQPTDGPDLVAQLHQWEADEHPRLGDATDQREMWIRGPEG